MNFIVAIVDFSWKWKRSPRKVWKKTIGEYDKEREQSEKLTEAEAWKNRRQNLKQHESIRSG